MDLGDLNKVWEIKALKKPEEDASENSKSEFCPNNPSLLGLNVGGGVHVKLRLRRPNQDWDFIPYDQVLDTMLHELCHNSHGPHNATFYKLWDDIRKDLVAALSRMDKFVLLQTCCSSLENGQVCSTPKQSFPRFQILDESLIATDLNDFRLKTGSNGLICDVDINRALDQV